MSEKISIQVCPKCGSDHVFELHWVNPNTAKIEDIDAESLQGLENPDFCGACDERIKIIDISEFKPNNTLKYAFPEDLIDYWNDEYSHNNNSTCSIEEVDYLADDICAYFEDDFSLEMIRDFIRTKVNVLEPAN